MPTEWSSLHPACNFTVAQEREKQAHGGFLPSFYPASQESRSDEQHRSVLDQSQLLVDPRYEARHPAVEGGQSPAAAEAV